MRLEKEKYFYKIKWLLNLNERYETKYRFFEERNGKIIEKQKTNKQKNTWRLETVNISVQL